MDEILDEIGERSGVLLLIFWSNKFDKDEASSVYATQILANMKAIEDVVKMKRKCAAASRNPHVDFNTYASTS